MHIRAMQSVCEAMSCQHDVYGCAQVGRYYFGPMHIQLTSISMQCMHIILGTVHTQRNNHDSN